MGAGAGDRPPADGGLAPGVGVLVRRLRPTGRPADPGGPPSVAGEARLEGGRGGTGTGVASPVPGLHRPSIRGVRSQGRPAVGHEGLFGGGNLAAVPDRRRTARPVVRSGHLDAVGALGRAAAVVVQLPGEEDVVRCQPEGRRQPVDGQLPRRDCTTRGCDRPGPLPGRHEGSGGDTGQPPAQQLAPAEHPGTLRSARGIVSHGPTVIGADGRGPGDGPVVGSRSVRRAAGATMPRPSERSGASSCTACSARQPVGSGAGRRRHGNDRVTARRYFPSPR